MEVHIYASILQDTFSSTEDDVIIEEDDLNEQSIVLNWERGREKQHRVDSRKVGQEVKVSEYKIYDK